jgi:hypothetical protein
MMALGNRLGSLLGAGFDRTMEKKIRAGRKIYLCLAQEGFSSDTTFCDTS